MTDYTSITHREMPITDAIKSLHEYYFWLKSIYPIAKVDLSSEAQLELMRRIKNEKRKTTIILQGLERDYYDTIIIQSYVSKRMDYDVHC